MGRHPEYAYVAAHIEDKDGNKLPIFSGPDGGDKYKRQDGFRTLCCKCCKCPPGRRSKGTSSSQDDDE